MSECKFKPVGHYAPNAEIAYEKRVEGIAQRIRAAVNEVLPYVPVEEMIVDVEDDDPNFTRAARRRVMDELLASGYYVCEFFGAFTVAKPRLAEIAPVKEPWWKIW